MKFDEMGNPSGKTLMLLPGTACDYQTNFGMVLDRLGEKNEKKKAKIREKRKSCFEMSEETADRFMGCFDKLSPESIKNEYDTDLLTWLRDDIHVEKTKVHFIPAGSQKN